jgi:hypothetical protein
LGIQSKKDKQKFSQLRQSLTLLSSQIREIIKPFFSDKPVIKGSVYELRRKCGKPGCQCEKGKLHSTMVLSSSEKGKTRLQVIPQGFLLEVKSKVNRYRKLRRCRRELGEVHKRMLEVMDKMEAIRREEIHSGGKH